MSEASAWILEANLRVFLERASAFVDYTLDEWDWDAVHFGVPDTDFAAGRWFSYPLCGAPMVPLAFARAGEDDRLAIRAEVEPAVAARIDALAFCLRFRLAEIDTLIEAAFAEVLSPGGDRLLNCDAAHEARCLECQDARAYFAGRRWQALLAGEDTLPRYVAGLELLTPEARLYFLPAYLAQAARCQDPELLEVARRSVDIAELSLVQQETVALVQRLVTA